MTRKQLAEEIYKMYQEKGGAYAISIDMKSWVNGVLKGRGAARPASKQYLIDWHDRMVSDREAANAA